MDPNEALEACRKSIQDFELADGVYNELDELLELVEAFQDLDNWLTKGGFKPKEWAGK